MSNIEWQDKFLVGVPRIDNEHRVFVDLIASMSCETDQADNRERVLGLLRELELYAQFHFCSEENIMKQANYPDVASHTADHTALLGMLKTRIRQYQTQTITLHDIAVFLFEWFSFHTIEIDRKMTRYLAMTHPNLVDAAV